MATREQVQRLLDAGYSYEVAARALRIPAGQAFMIATGLPADGSEAPTPEELAGKPPVPASTQQLLNPPAHNPTRKPHLLEWVRERAHRELERDA